MPVILAPRDYARWLGDEPDPRDLIQPFPADPMRMWAISTRVNKPENDNGPEFVAKAVQEWIAAVGAKIAYIERGSPWENGYIESFNARLRDELLNSEIFYTLQEAQIVIESWRRHYNTIRPHASLGYKP